MQIQSLSRQELLDKTQFLVAEERRITSELLLHLREIERRSLHLEMGHSSLFDFLVKHLGYSESAAYRRLSAMRLSKEVPEVVSSIQEGKLSLSTASQLQSFFTSEKKRDREYTSDEKTALTTQLMGLSRREAESKLLAISPESRVTERERQITATETEIRFVVGEELYQKLERLKALLAHTGELGYAKLIEKLADLALKRMDPEQRTTRTQSAEDTRRTVSPPAEVRSGIGRAPDAAPTRFIPAALRRPIWRRASGRCEYRAPDGKRCASQWAMQVDHVLAFALGGTSDPENLRLLCRAHNLHAAEKIFGIREARVRNSM